MTSSDEYDCTSCGACCFGRRDYVQVFPHDITTLGEAKTAEFVAPPVGESPASIGRPAEDTRFMKMSDGHCAALRTDVPNKFLCKVYENRPTLCHALVPGSTPCLEARARRGFSVPK